MVSLPAVDAADSRTSPAPALNPKSAVDGAHAGAGEDSQPSGYDYLDAETIATEGYPSVDEDDQRPSDVDPPRQPRPRERDRDTRDQAPQRHITGEDAMRLANQANRAAGAMKAIESPHKGYRRP